MSSRVRRLAVGTAVLLLGACATSPPPRAEPPSARGATAAASAAGTPSAVVAARRHATQRPAAAGPSPAPPVPAARGTALPSKVLLIVEENHTATAALSGMPYLAGLARSYGYTTDYQAITHPSLPNYLALAGGSTFGVADDAGPAAHPVTGPSVFDQALAEHRSAKLYAESMPGTCARDPAGRYAVKHNPWAYFADAAARAACRRLDVPSGTPARGALHADVAAGTLPTVGMLVPDLCDDAHDCPLGTADRWLRGWVPQLLGGTDFRSGRLAVVVTFDEDDSSGPNTVLTVVISPTTRHVVARAALRHYSWTRYAEQLAGAPLLGGAAASRSLRGPFPI